MEIFAHFPIIQAKKWFKDGLTILKVHKIEEEYYNFPKEFLVEQNTGYWVNGSYNSLGLNRRKKNWKKIESTYLVIKIESIISGSS